MDSKGGKLNPWVQALQFLDLTQIFREKGSLRRWSAKRTVGGAVVLEGLWQIHEYGITWPGIALVALGLTPLCLSLLASKG